MLTDQFRVNGAKLLSEEELNNVLSALQMENGDVMLIVSDIEYVTQNALGRLLLVILLQKGPHTRRCLQFLMGCRFSSSRKDEESGNWHAMHHPFTSPRAEDMDKLETDPGSIKAQADVVLNGTELGGGSIRIHNPEVQKADV